MKRDSLDFSSSISSHDKGHSFSDSGKKAHFQETSALKQDDLKHYDISSRIREIRERSDQKERRKRIQELLNEGAGDDDDDEEEQDQEALQKYGQGINYEAAIGNHKFNKDDQEDDEVLNKKYNDYRAAKNEQKGLQSAVATQHSTQVAQPHHDNQTLESQQHRRNGSQSSSRSSSQLSQQRANRQRHHSGAAENNGGKKETFEEIEHRIRRLEDDLTSVNQKVQSENKQKEHTFLPAAISRITGIADSHTLQQERINISEAAGAYSSNFAPNPPPAVAVKNFVKFEREAQALNQRVDQIKRELEESDSSDNESNAQGKKKTLKPRYQAQPDLHREKGSSHQLEEKIHKKQHEKHKKSERELIIKSLQREKELLSEIAKLQKQNALYKTRLSNVDQTYSIHQLQQQEGRQLPLSGSQQGQNVLYSRQPSMPTEPSRSAQKNLRAEGNLHENVSQSVRFNEEEEDLQQQQQQENNTKKVFQSEKTHGQATQLRSVMHDGDLTKLEKEIELFKTIERIRKKLKKSIMRRINDEKLILKEKQKQEEARHGRSAHQSHSQRRAKSPYTSNHSGVRHCENCAFLLNKGIPTSFCSCTKRKN